MFYASENEWIDTLDEVKANKEQWVLSEKILKEKKMANVFSEAIQCHDYY